MREQTFPFTKLGWEQAKSYKSYKAHNVDIKLIGTCLAIETFLVVGTIITLAQFNTLNAFNLDVVTESIDKAFKMVVNNSVGM